MSIVSVKRARVTARIAQSEVINLPYSSINTQSLLEQTEQKRKLLDKKCEEVEQLCKNISKLNLEKKILLNDSQNLTTYVDEINEEFAKVQKKAEVTLLSQKQSDNEWNLIHKSWIEKTEKTKKLQDDLKSKSNFAEETERKCNQLLKRFEKIGTMISSNEGEIVQLSNAFENDMKTEKTLEHYLSRLVNDVFMNQRKMEDIHLGTSNQRTSIRQAEKLLREQKRAHRKLSSQFGKHSETEKGNIDETPTSYHKRVDQLENKWAELKNVIRLKEKEIIESISKINEVKHNEEKRKQLLAKEELAINEMRIAKDYNFLQKDTPMYAAYTASTDYGCSFRLRSEKPTIAKTERLDAPHSTTGYDVVKMIRNSNEFENISYPHEYTELMENRKKILKSSENEAYSQMNSELKKLDGLVSGQRQNTQTLEREIKAIRDNIKVRQNDILSYQRKLSEFNRIYKQGRNEKEEELHHIDPCDKSNINNTEEEVNKGCHNLRNQRVLLEEERKLLQNELKECNLEYSKLSETWKIHGKPYTDEDIQASQDLSSEIKSWDVKVKQLENEIEKLEKMESNASVVNRKLRNNLEILKPYDFEYQQYEKLVEANKILDKKIMKYNAYQTSDLQNSGDIISFMNP